MYVGYIDEVVKETVQLCEDRRILELVEIPEPLCSGFYGPEKEFAIQKHRTRFSTL